MSGLPDESPPIATADGQQSPTGIGQAGLPPEIQRGVEQSLIYARELRRVFVDLERKEEQHKVLLAKLMSAQEDERRRIAIDIHDEVLQMLGFNLMKIDLVERLWQKGDNAAALEHLNSLRDTIEQAINLLREIINNLRPATLDHQGLLPALDEYLKRLQRETGIEVYLNSRLGRRQPPAIETLVFRLVQEALANVRKHARAKSVSVMLESRDNRVHVTIEDDGRGFVVGEALQRSLERGSIGLHSLIERIELAGGTWEIESQPGAGARIRFNVPA